MQRDRYVRVYLQRDRYVGIQPVPPRNPTPVSSHAPTNRRNSRVGGAGGKGGRLRCAGEGREGAARGGAEEQAGEAEDVGASDAVDLLSARLAEGALPD